MSAIWDLQKSHRTFGDAADIQKAFYHPTERRKVDARMKKTKLSCGEANQHEKGSLDHYDLEFFKGSNIYLNLQSAETHQLDWSQEFPSFDESWPNSERPSTVDQSDHILESTVSSTTRNTSRVESDALSGLMIVKVAAEPKKTTKANFRQQESVLSKYVQRFRKAAPQSRETRLKSNPADPSDFWWLHDTSLNSNKELDMQTEEMKDLEQRSNISSANYLPDFAQSRRSKLDSWLDKDTQLLQSKTDSLLDRAASSMSSSSHPIVSTTGLGSEPSTYSGSVIDEVSYRPRFSRVEESSAVVSSQDGVRPVDDILEQWRRRRRLDQAMERIKQVDMERDHFQPVHHISSTIEAFRRRLALNASSPSDVAVGMATGPPRFASDGFHVSGKKDADAQTSFDDFSRVDPVSSNHNTASSPPLRPTTRTASTDELIHLKSTPTKTLNVHKSDQTTHVDHRCLETSNSLSSVEAPWCRGPRSSSEKETTEWSSGELSKEKEKRRTRVRSTRTKAQRDRDLRQFDSQEKLRHLHDTSQSVDEEKTNTPEAVSRTMRDDEIDLCKTQSDERGTLTFSEEFERSSILASPRLNDVDSVTRLHEDLENVSFNSLPAPAVNDLRRDGDGDGDVKPKLPGPRPIPRSTRPQGQNLVDVSGHSASRNGDAEIKVAAPRASSSSPSRIRNSIISQVVNDHMFDMSDSLTVVSSLGNYSSANHEATSRQSDDVGFARDQDHHQLHDSLSAAQPQRTDDGLQSLIVSDEDEFHEDDILRDLRQRRSVFVRLLKQLDDELAARNDNDNSNVQNNPPNPVDEQS